MPKSKNRSNHKVKANRRSKLIRTEKVRYKKMMEALKARYLAEVKARNTGTEDMIKDTIKDLNIGTIVEPVKINEEE